VSSPWRDAVLKVRLLAIGELLQRHAALWRLQAFTHLQMPWEADYPQLTRRLRALSLERAEQLAANENELGDFLREFIPAAPDVQRAAAVPPFLSRRLPDGELFENGIAARDIPGRKWQQITAFAATFSADTTSSVDSRPVLEWCAGQAHLGRLLARTDTCAVTALEWDTELIAAGQRLAQRDKLPMTFHCVDVLSPRATDHIHSDQRVVALHACGDLHTQLLRSCAQQKPHALILAPCCYHLTRDRFYRPLSQCAASNNLLLARDDLRTAVQGSVTSPARVQRQRKQLQAWRLGFDLLQRELRGRDEYLAIPSFSARILHEGFAAFCCRLAQLKNLSLPAQPDYHRYEQAGYERLREVTVLDLPRLLFRRALEVWLLLDRAIFLQDSGYTVAVGTFCERALTPRNLLIQAHY
jgi:hypothetical protein